MKKMLLIVIFASTLFKVFAQSSDTQEVNSCLIKLMARYDSLFAKISSEYQIAAQPTALIYDYTMAPDSSQWTGQFDRDFNMEFGVYYIGAINSYLLIHHKSLTVYKPIWPDAVTPKLVEHIIRIKEEEPALVSEKQFLNIIKNLIIPNRVDCRFALTNKKQFNVLKWQGMTVIEQLY